MIEYRLATEKDEKKIAELHHDYINKGFLSELGINFLELLYKAMIKSNEIVCIVAEKENEIIGFVSGAIDLKKFYKEFLKENFLKATFKIFPKVFNPKILLKIYETIFYPIKINQTIPHAELLSIVVKKEYQGKNIGEELFKYLKKEFKKRGVSEFKVIVGENLPKAVKFYEKMNGKLIGKIEVHRGNISRIYGWKI